MPTEQINKFEAEAIKIVETYKYFPIAQVVTDSINLEIKPLLKELFPTEIYGKVAFRIVVADDGYIGYDLFFLDNHTEHDGVLRDAFAIH